MLKPIRRVAWCAALLAGLSALRPAVVRADDPLDYNAYWQAAASTTPSQTQDYNAYWAQVQAQQQAPGG
jgi:hypothetical protein